MQPHGLTRAVHARLGLAGSAVCASNRPPVLRIPSSAAAAQEGARLLLRGRGHQLPLPGVLPPSDTPVLRTGRLPSVLAFASRWILCFVAQAEWEAYTAAIPKEEHAGGFIAAYGRRLRGEMGEEEKYKAAKAWSIWEGSVSRLRPPTRDAILAKWGDDDFSLAFARIENHYFTGANGVAGFFPRDGWLLERANLAKISHIPTVIVQGRYDVVCPAVSAYDLHQRLPDSTLHVTTTGHSSFEPEIIERLVEATESFKAA